MDFIKPFKSHQEGFSTATSTKQYGRMIVPIQGYTGLEALSTQEITELVETVLRVVKFNDKEQ